MDQILDIDADAMTVTVQPGVVWQKLEKVLHKQGLALRTYLSSAPSSTVGGWLAQGGVGFGAYEYGAFRDNVVSCRAVLPDGDVHEFVDDPAAAPQQSLDLISEAEGITGLITQVTIRVRRHEPEVIRGARFDNAGDLARALNAIREAGLPLWSVSFVNPKMARLKNQLPPHMEHGHVVETHRPAMPEAHVAILVAPQSRRSSLEEQLSALIADAGGVSVDEEVARHEWADRFDLTHVKRLGPSVAPAEVLVPLQNLAPALQGIADRVKLPIVMEGMVDGNGEVSLLGFILHDERTFGFNFAFGLALTVLKVAKQNGGRAYATGLYFAHEAHNVLGAERLGRLRELKRKVDPSIEHLDLTAYALQMWSVFEAMINLLQPEAMADFMADLLPQMIAAMPGPFPAMMNMGKSSPGPVREAMIRMMRPMMPFLFPRLLPGMMPKVMPDMLAAVGQRIDMPAEMEEQMPDLMPPAMERLMPKMLPLIIPYFLPRMEDYLRGQAGNGR